MPNSTSRLLGAAACLLLAACGNGNDTRPPGAPSPVAEPPAPSEPARPSQPATAPTEPSLEFAALPAPFNMADYDRGRRTWRLCSSCHLLEAEGGHRVGPNLHGMFGREVGMAEGFVYSDALVEADFAWTPAELDEWLANPRTYLPGNRMSFSGVRRPEDRVAVIAYIMAETGYGETTPSGE